MSGRRRAGESGARGARSARVAVIVVCLAALSIACASGCARGRAKYPEVRALDGTVSIVTEDLAAGSARFFTFRDHSGRTADFFVYRESGGAARAALDACRTCARWKKGYRPEGRKMVCIYCGMHYDIDTLAKGIGSCVPIALPASQAGDRIHIAAEGLEEGLRYF